MHLFLHRPVHSLLLVKSMPRMRLDDSRPCCRSAAATCEQGSIFRRKTIFRTAPETKNFRFSGFFRIFQSENDLKFKFRFSKFSDRKMLLVIGSCKISEEKLKNLQHTPNINRIHLNTCMSNCPYKSHNLNPI